MRISFLFTSLVVIVLVLVLDASDDGVSARRLCKKAWNLLRKNNLSRACGQKFKRCRRKNNLLRRKCKTNILPKDDIVEDDFEQKFLDKHNLFRAVHHADPLVLNATISAFAQTHANELASTGSFVHNPNIGAVGYGENLYSATISVPPFLAKFVVDTWYSEGISHQFWSNDADPDTAHFTQIVWKSTEQLGCGVAMADDGEIIVVANYYPQGNIDNEYLANVQMP